jgi:hypothetical protein
MLNGDSDCHLIPVNQVGLGHIQCGLVGLVLSKNKLSDPETVLGMIRPIQMDRV